ncbi:MAG: peptidylprolyl isomerase [Sutterella sp.]|nr:peptidylprolyl isomerase [Sutterella sp.]
MSVRHTVMAATATALLTMTALPSLAAQVLFETNLGNFVVDVNEKASPKTASNFLRYVNEGFYNNTIFHRVIGNFMVQGGGFEPGMVQKQTHEPIALESKNGLTNKRGTIAMARTMDPNSATSQFFINLKNNHFLDASQSPDGNGYAVFGQVISGMDTIDKIAEVKTHSVGYHDDVPIRNVVIKKVTVLKGQ